MNNKLFRFDENVPSIYLEESRDFQVLERLLTFGLSSTIGNVEQLKYLNDCRNCPSSLIGYLSKKVGFFESDKYSNDYVRSICSCFQYLVRKKGTESSLVDSVYLFYKIKGLETTSLIKVTNKSDNPDESYTIQVGLQQGVSDVDLLRDILQYVMPTGYKSEIFFYTDVNYITELYNKYLNSVVITRDGMKQHTLYNTEETYIPSIQNMIVGSNE